MFYLSSATRWAVSWAGDDMMQASVVDSISPARCRVLPSMAPPCEERVATLQKNNFKVYRKYSVQFISMFGRNIKLWLQELEPIAIFL